MNQTESLEDRLESLGETLRDRPQLTDRVLEELQRADTSSSFASPAVRRSMQAPRRFLLAAIGTALAIALVATAITLLPAPRVGWAQVTAAVRSQAWIRGRITFENGERGTMWLSPERQVWAFRMGKSSRFFDAREQIKYEHRGGESPIIKLPLGEDNAQRILPIGALSEDGRDIGSWVFGEKVVQQTRREVNEDGKTWIEFQMKLWRGEMNQATLRVDPKTKLPVHLLLRSSKDSAKTLQWSFDYPANGPADIYALGVPRDTKIDALMPERKAREVLDALAASRGRIGDFRMLAASKPGFNGYAVWRQGDRWRIDICYPQTNDWLAAACPDDHSAGACFDEQLELVERVPLYICDGKNVSRNPNIRSGTQPQWQASPRLAPQDLMSGDGLGRLSGAGQVKVASLLYPDLSLNPGWGFEFDMNPAEAPGLVLIKRSARLASTKPRVGHEWYYFDPTKGHALVRAELFNLPLDTPADPEAAQIRQTIRTEEFEKSPNGVWYCRVVNDRTPISNPNLGQDGPTGYHETITRYHFDFDPDLKDSIFKIDSE